MSYIDEESPNIKAMIELFGAIKELNGSYTMDNAVDVLDAYIKTGNPDVLPVYDGFRDRIANSNIREVFQPIYEEGYNHLFDYVNNLTPSKGKSK